MNMGEKPMRRKFTPEFREQAVKRVLAGHKAAVVARELDIGESLLHNGLARYRWRNGAEAWQAEQTVEITRLKRLLAQRDAEVAILKKAAAYFARESRSGTPLSARMSRCLRSRRCAGCCE
jgi:transposase